MGYSRSSSTDWTTYTTSKSRSSTRDIFKGYRLDDGLNPLKVDFRESRDSKANPNSTPIALFFDVTGSMGEMPANFVRKGAGILLPRLYEGVDGKVPVADPHVLIGAIGDMHCDSAPLQVSQFESQMEPLTTQIEKLFLEGNGGGNDSESYHGPWYWAARHTKHDAWEKRGKKGYLFTVGDENVPPPLTREQIKKFIGDNVERNFSAQECLEMAQKTWHVFHVRVQQGSGCRSSHNENWRKLLNQHLLMLDDIDKLTEVVASAIEVVEGASVDTVVNSWSGSTAITVRNAIKNLTKGDNTGGVVRV